MGFDREPPKSRGLLFTSQRETINERAGCCNFNFRSIIHAELWVITDCTNPRTLTI